MRLATLLLTLIIAACAPGDTPASPPLVGSVWILKSMPGWEMQQAPQIPMLEFRASNAVGGRAGCNTWGGTVELSGTRVKFSAMYMTEMACAYGMDVEQRYLDVLGRARTLTVTGETLTLADETGTTIATFFRGSKIAPP